MQNTDSLERGSLIICRSPFMAFKILDMILKCATFYIVTCVYVISYTT